MEHETTPEKGLLRHLRRPWLIGSIALVVIAAVAVGYQMLKRPADIDRGEEVAFVEDEPAAGEPRRASREPRTTNWPMFGFDRARTRALAADHVRPPYKRLWRYSDEPLLEFPPIYVNGVLYLVDNDGRAFAFDADTGRQVWQRQIAELNATSPTYSEGRLYIANLRPGQLISLNARNGRTIWTKRLDARTESSPVVVGNRVYFGAEDGNLYAVDKRNGRTIWTTGLAGEVKAAPAYHEGTLYVGDYGGEMSAVRARDGQILWQAGSQGLSFSRSGAFYSTPAVAFGRVYSGNNDGRVYSFDAATGELAWTRSTGGWVYSGPAVARTENSPPTVYIGSFDGNMYALDARTGDTRFTRSAGGSVVGSLSVIGNIVYVSSFDPKQTRGFDVRNGEQVFHYHTGAYMPAISDGRRLYLTGYSSIHALEPIPRRQLRQAERRKQAREAAQRRKQRQVARARHVRQRAAQRRQWVLNRRREAQRHARHQALRQRRQAQIRQRQAASAARRGGAAQSGG